MGCLNRFEFGGLLESVWVQCWRTVWISVLSRWVTCWFGIGFFLGLSLVLKDILASQAEQGRDPKCASVSARGGCWSNGWEERRSLIREERRSTVMKSQKERKNKKLEKIKGFDTQLRYGSHKKVEIFKWWKLKTVSKRVGCSELGYFKWWVMSDEWWVMSDENWVMSDEWWNKKNPNRALISMWIFSSTLDYHHLQLEF